MTDKPDKPPSITESFRQVEQEDVGLISTFAPGDAEYWHDLQRRIKKDPDYDMAEHWCHDFIRRPPSMEEFVTDDYWLGSTLRPSADSQGLFPAWKEILVRDFGLNSQIHNVVLTGSLGTGKTFNMVAILLYRMTLTTLLKNPQVFFDMSAGSAIVYNTLSITKAAVTETAFGEAMNFMGRSPYFREQCGFNPDNLYTNGRISMGKGVYLTAGSKGWHLLGRNVLGVALDEGNWRNESNPDQKAYELYNEVRTRIANRFLRIQGFLPAISLIASSAKDESSFTEMVIKEIEEAKDPTHQVVYRNSVYKIKRHTLKLSQKWFKVGHGVKNMEPVVLTGWYTEQGEPTEGEAHETPPSGMVTELVPEIYLKEFQRHPRTALQSIAGISTGGSNRLFSHMLDVHRCVEMAERDGVLNPCRAGVDMIPISSEDNLNIWDYLDHKQFLNKVMGRIQPKRHPDAARFGHMDLATQSKAGVAVCHLVGAQLVDGLIKDGQAFSEYRLIVEYDFILTITAGRTKPINLEKIQRFFFWLVERCGYRFGLVTADQFQCLAGETLVNTARGLIPLASVLIGDTVQSRTGPAKVINKFKYPVAPVVRITTDQGDVITGTPIHRLEASKKCTRLENAKFQWIQMGDLREGDFLRMADQPVEFDCEDQILESVEWNQTYPDSEIQHWVPPVRMSPQFAEWLGLYYGDGCSTDAGAILITCHADEAAEAAETFRRAFGVSPKVHFSRRANSSTVRIYCKNMVKWMKHNGISKAYGKGRGGCEIKIPELIMKSSRAVKGAFMRGLFSADGCMHEVNGASLSTKWIILAQQVRVLLRTEFGLRSTLITSNRVEFGKNRTQYIVRVGGSRKRFYESIGFCYKAKSDILNKSLLRPGRRLCPRVAKIGYSYASVYDIEVEGDHSYVANGVISHNSSMPLQMMEARGFKVDKQSLDRDKSGYYAWRTAFEELRLRPYQQYQMLREIEQLVDGEKKIDHPPGGEKDACDAAAGCYVNAINSDEKFTILSDNSPSIYAGGVVDATVSEKPPIEFNLPLGYTRIQTFNV